MLEFRSGGWVLLLAAALCVFTVAMRIPGLLRAARSPAIGDGRNAESYRFDLSNCLVRRDLIVGSGYSKDEIEALNEPKMLTVAQAEEFHQHLRRRYHTKYLVSADRVIGVEIAGDARAYPLRQLNWNYVINDVIGGRPVAVTYDPLCDSAVVFSRNVGGRTLEFAVSGLLYNSNLLMFDRRPDGQGESLWSQLQFRAIAGPAAEKTAQLEVLPAAVVRWKTWRARFPQTRVMALNVEHIDRFKRTYSAYQGAESIMFPVEPLPATNELRLKGRIVALKTNGRWRFAPLNRIAARADESGRWSMTLDGRALHFDYHPDPPTVWVRSAAQEDTTVSSHAFWFAWHAMHPESGSLVP